jgi:Short C-terminal domain
MWLNACGKFPIISPLPSKRGKHSQSTEPSRLTSAAEQQSGSRQPHRCRLRRHPVVGLAARRRTRGPPEGTAGDAPDRPRRRSRRRRRARCPHHEQHRAHRRDVRHRRWAAVRLGGTAQLHSAAAGASLSPVANESRGYAPMLRWPHGGDIRLRARQIRGPRRGSAYRLPELSQPGVPPPCQVQEVGTSLLRAGRALRYGRLPGVSHLQPRSSAQPGATATCTIDAHRHHVVPCGAAYRGPVPGEGRAALAPLEVNVAGQPLATTASPDASPTARPAAAAPAATPATAAAGPAQPEPAAADDETSWISQLGQLAQLHDQGVLSDDDYEAAKRRLLQGH